MSSYYKISCIIPVYNKDKYLSKSLLSIVNQVNFNDIELIIVDDNSNDNSVNIIKNFAKVYSNIKFFINSKNMGPSYSRNKGLMHASGEYVHFIDGDDFLYKNTIYKDIFQQINKNYSPDIIVCDYYKQYKFLKKLCTKKHELLNGIYKSIPEKEYFLKNNMVIWNKIYKRSFLQENEITFTEGLLCEDIDFHWKSIISSSIIYYINYVLYVYVRTSRGSRSKDVNSYHVKKSFDAIYKFLVEKNIYNLYEKVFLKKSKSHNKLKNVSKLSKELL